MAHCAEIDENGIVKRVIAVEDTYGELTCEQWCEKTFGGTWKQTSYNTKGGIHYDPNTKLPSGKQQLRKNYAGIGYQYDKLRDAFIPPKPKESAVLNELTCQWKEVI